MDKRRTTQPNNGFALPDEHDEIQQRSVDLTAASAQNSSEAMQKRRYSASNQNLLDAEHSHQGRQQHLHVPKGFKRPANSDGTGWQGTPDRVPSSPIGKSGPQAVPDVADGKNQNCCVCDDPTSCGSRHHCRCCGALTCGSYDCSEKEYMKIGDNGRQRFCSPCQDKFRRCGECSGKGKTGLTMKWSCCPVCKGSGEISSNFMRRRLLSPRYRGSPVLLRLLDEIRTENDRVNDNRHNQSS